MIRRSDGDTETPLRLHPSPSSEYVGATSSEYVGDMYISNEDSVEVIDVVENDAVKFALVVTAGGVQGYVRLSVVYPPARKRNVRT